MRAPVRPPALLVLAALLAAAALGPLPGCREAPAATHPTSQATVDCPRSLEVVPLGKPSRRLIADLATALRERFTFCVRVHERVRLPAAAWYQPRKRWRAEKLLDALDDLETGDAWKVVGITGAPISTTKGARYDWGIAGLARLPGRSSVLTAYLFRRVKKRSPKTYNRYMIDLVFHELGHTLGLPHCPLDRCIMADAKGNALRSARSCSHEFCPRCTRRIARWLRDATARGTWSPEELAILERRP